jgi:hypothetical protein
MGDLIHDLLRATRRHVEALESFSMRVVPESAVNIALVDIT